MDENRGSDYQPGELDAMLITLMGWHRNNPGTSNGGSAEIANSVAHTLWKAGRDWQRQQESAQLRAAEEREARAEEMAKHWHAALLNVIDGPCLFDCDTKSGAPCSCWADKVTVALAAAVPARHEADREGGL